MVKKHGAMQFTTRNVTSGKLVYKKKGINYHGKRYTKVSIRERLIDANDDRHILATNFWTVVIVKYKIKNSKEILYGVYKGTKGY